jgi:hypothetical protein
MSETLTKWRMILDHEKEEAWLNEMSQQGWAFDNYLLGRYRFKKSAPGEFIYRIALLDGRPSSTTNKEYLASMHEHGIEVASQWSRWIYFKKPSADGEFEVYPDIESQIMHNDRIAKMFLGVGVMELLISYPQFERMIQYLNGDGDAFSMVSLIFAPLLLLLGILFLARWFSLKQKIKRLRAQQTDDE